MIRYYLIFRKCTFNTMSKKEQYVRYCHFAMLHKVNINPGGLYRL